MPIILSSIDVAKRLSTFGLDVRFAPDFPASPKITTDAIDRCFCFPTAEDNSGLTLDNLLKIMDLSSDAAVGIYRHEWLKSQAFLQTPCPPGWHLLGMDVPPETLDRSYNDLCRLNKGAGPLAIEVVLMLLLHFKGSGERLLAKKHTWCCDRDNDGRQVTVGAFGKHGIFVSAHDPEYRSRGLGLSSSVWGLIDPKRAG